MRGFGFLIDYNPPWDGSIKDIIACPQRSPEAAIRDFVECWAEQGRPLAPISAVEAKQKILESLECNRKADIRLPRDLITSREPFPHYVLTLPDGPETPPFTIADFDALAQAGQRPEEIMHFEQRVGRRVRLADGKEVMIMGADEEWD